MDNFDGSSGDPSPHSRITVPSPSRRSRTSLQLLRSTSSSRLGMLPSRLSRRATVCFAASTPSLPRRPAFSTVCAASSTSRRALNLSPALCYPRSPRNISTSPSDGKEPRPPKAKGSSSAATPAASGAPVKRSNHKAVLPKGWIERNVSVPRTHEALVAEAEAAAPPAASTPASSPAAPESDPSAASPPPARPPQTDLERLQSRLKMLPSEASLETLKATLVSSLIVGSKGAPEPASSLSANEAVEEPVVGVYCPLEDAGLTTVETVREVVARLGGDLVVLDAVELCAEGEGALGRATSHITLSPNPLKVRSGETTNNQVSSPSVSGGPELSKFEEDMEEEEEEEEEEDEEDDHFGIDLDHDDGPMGFRDEANGAGQAHHAVGASENTRNSRTRKRWAEDKDGEELPSEQGPEDSSSPGSSRASHLGGQPKPLPGFQLRPSEPSPLDSLFSEIVEAEASPKASSDLPRIVFIKDAHLIAATFESPSLWYAALKRAVQSRRASGRPTSIVLGLGPTLLEPIARFEVSTREAPTLPPGVEELMPPDYLEKQAKRLEELNAYVPQPFLRKAALERSYELLKQDVPDTHPGLDAVTRARLDKMSREEWGALVPSFSTSSGSARSGNSTSPFSRSGLPGGFLSSAGGPDGPGNIGSVLSDLARKGNLTVMELPFAPANSRALKDLLSGSRPFPFPGFGFGGDAQAPSGSQKVLWKLVGVFPRARNDTLQKAALIARVKQRIQINSLLFTMALADGRGKFVGGLGAVRARVEQDLAQGRPAGKTDDAVKDNGKVTDKSASDDALKVTLEHDIATSILAWDQVVKLAGDAVGLSLSQSLSEAKSLEEATSESTTPSASPETEAVASSYSPKAPFSSPTSPLAKKDLRALFLTNQRVAVTWEHILAVGELDIAVRNEYRSVPLKGSKATGAAVKGAKASGDDDATAPKPDKEDEPDTVVEALKKDGTLNKYEKKVLSTIVDRRGLREGFDDVHLPEKTVDAIRSVVSLPLLFPEAFSSGILKNHATSGALLFGPPGTGKTLVVRALAKESGARMMSIQPSDVMDMYFGEAEKLVKAVFSIARKLSPCIVFIDELDALFEARSGGSKGGGDSARRQMLTEFMQEMDGLSSASKNKDRGLVVIGATNRPQDLDEAVLRRLPRRLMIDLPAEKEREAILKLLLKTETLADDVDLAKLAKDTATFSGSDLKHLCVMAAQEAIKEQYSVPWLTRKPTASAGASDASSPSSASPSPSSSKPAKAPIDIPIFPGSEETSPAAPDAPEPVPVTPTSVEAAMASDRLTTARIAIREGGEASSSTVAAHVTKADPAPSTSPADLSSSAKTPLKANADPADGESNASAVASAEQAPATPSSKPEPKPRVLTKAHFDYALKNSSSSGSEELGALPELRKWNEQFGDAGSKKNKRSGFGKGFGFGEREEKKL